MLYEAKTPTEYLSQLEDDWRKEKLQQLRALVQTHAPEATETIHYKMLGYKQGEEFLFHLNAQKGYVSFYVGNVAKVDPDGEMLKNVSHGKGCIRFKKSVAVEDSGISEFLARFMELHTDGKNLGCH